VPWVQNKQGLELCSFWFLKKSAYQETSKAL
jgi:hypothetical protein